MKRKRHPLPSLPYPEAHRNIPTHMHTRVNTHTCVTTHMRPDGFARFTVFFLATILSSFLAIRTSSSASPMPAAHGSPGFIGCRSKAEAAAGRAGRCQHGGAGRVGRAGKEWRKVEKKGGKEREGRASRKEVGLSQPVINSCQAGKIARGRAKYSWKRQAGPGLLEPGEARAGVHRDTWLSQPRRARGCWRSCPQRGRSPVLAQRRAKDRAMAQPRVPMGGTSSAGAEVALCKAGGTH